MNEPVTTPPRVSRSKRLSLTRGIQPPSPLSLGTANNNNNHKQTNSAAKKGSNNNNNNSSSSSSSNTSRPNINGLCCQTKDGTIQELQDRIEELQQTTNDLQERATSFEFQFQHLQVAGRLDANKVAIENVDLKEQNRKLNIRLSSVEDERDAVAQEKESVEGQIAELEDEAFQMSTQLKATWLQISTLRDQHTDSLKKLVTAEIQNQKLSSDLERAIEVGKTCRDNLTEERKVWEAEKVDLVAEVKSLSAKLKKTVDESGQQQMQSWDEDRERLQTRFRMEKETWEAEKKRFQDQVASFRLKLTSAVLKPRAPAEWIMEKQRLEDRNAELQAQLETARESNQAMVFSAATSTAALAKSSSPSGGALGEKERQKLEKKLSAIKEKMREMVEHTTKIQAEADADRASWEIERKKLTAGGKPTRSAGRPRVKATKASAKTDVQSEVDKPAVAVEVETQMEEDEEPPIPIRRAKRSAAVKKVNYHVDTASESEDSMEVDSDSDGVDNEEEEEEEDGSGDDKIEESEETQEKESAKNKKSGQQQSAIMIEDSDEDMRTESSPTPAELPEPPKVNMPIDVVETNTNKASSPSPATAPSTPSKRKPKARRILFDDSDSDFEMPVLQKSVRFSKTARAMAAPVQESDESSSGKVKSPTKKATAAAPTNGRKRTSTAEDDLDDVVTNTPPAKLSPVLEQTAMIAGPKVAPAGISSPSSSSVKEGLELESRIIGSISGPTAASSSSSSSSSATLTSNGALDGLPTKTDKAVKKKRKLLTGKAFDELDIGNANPGGAATGTISNTGGFGIKTPISSIGGGGGSLFKVKRPVGTHHTLSGTSPTTMRSGSGSAPSSPSKSSIGGAGLTAGQARKKKNLEALNAIKMQFSIPKARAGDDNSTDNM